MKFILVKFRSFYIVCSYTNYTYNKKYPLYNSFFVECALSDIMNSITHVKPCALPSQLNSYIYIRLKFENMLRRFSTLTNVRNKNIEKKDLKNILREKYLFAQRIRNK